MAESHSTQSTLTAKQRAVLQAASNPWFLSVGKIGRSAGIEGEENTHRHLRALRSMGLVFRVRKPASSGLRAGYCYRTTKDGEKVLQDG